MLFRSPRDFLVVETSGTLRLMVSSHLDSESPSTEPDRIAHPSRELLGKVAKAFPSFERTTPPNKESVETGGRHLDAVCETRFATVLQDQNLGRELCECFALGTL